MNIIAYFKTVKDRINKINSYIQNPFLYKDKTKPYYCKLIQTYIWIDKDDND
ncbi:hypothetical protein II906_11685 [bacterium]|nr:hypothetical protein [bacterium]